MKKWISRRTLKIILSLGLCYHLFVIAIVPNTGSFIERYFEGVTHKYANFLILNTNWRFFSPDPAYVMYYEYRVAWKDVEKEELVYHLPPDKNQMTFNPNRRRLIYTMRILMLFPDLIEEMFIPWVCRQNPGAEYIQVRQFVERVPHFEKAQILKQSIEEMKEVERMEPIVGDCEERVDGVASVHQSTRSSY